MKEKSKARIGLIASMTIFGTIGIFRRYIPLSSSFIAMVRGLVGALFLLLVMLFIHRKPDKEAIRKNLLLLVVSGGLIGINWMLLFEAYNYTTVATATLCYYLAPTFTILLAPLVIQEKLTKKSVICVLISLVGMVFVSGFWEVGIKGTGELIGVLFGIGAALLYATVVLMNKRFYPIPAYDRTSIQLLFAGVVLLPYVLLTEAMSDLTFTPFTIVMLAIVSIVHTGIAYAIYFASFEKLPAKTLAMFSYIDPIVAVLLSVLLLHEQMTGFTAIGAVLILGSAIWSEQGND